MPSKFLYEKKQVAPVPEGSSLLTPVAGSLVPSEPVVRVGDGAAPFVKEEPLPIVKEPVQIGIPDPVAEPEVNEDANIIVPPYPLMARKKYNTPMSDATGYLELAEIDRIINVIENEKHRLLFKVLSRTGRRVSEIVGQRSERDTRINKETGLKETFRYKSIAPGLRPKDVNADRNELTFFILKGKGRYIRTGISRIPPSLMAELTAYIAQKKLGHDVPIFPISRQYTYMLFRGYAKKVGIETVGSNPPKKIHTHVLRHSWAIIMSRAAKNPQDIINIKKGLGHGRIDTTMWYIEKFNTEQMGTMVKEAFGE